MVIRAKYEKGVFKPLDKVDLKEGTVLDIYLRSDEGQRPSVRDLAFAGMWRNRRDIADGVSYVDRLREAPRA